MPSSNIITVAHRLHDTAHNVIATAVQIPIQLKSKPIEVTVYSIPIISSMTIF